MLSVVMLNVVMQSVVPLIALMFGVNDINYFYVHLAFLQKISRETVTHIILWVHSDAD
jgi:hypothetical protein